MNQLLLCIVFASALLCASGAATTKGNNEFEQAWNAAISSLKTSGELNNIIVQWYGSGIISSSTCTATYPATPTTGGVLANIVSSRVINMCSFYSSPNRFVNATGALVGADVDIIAAVVAKLNTQYPASTPITVNNINTAFGDLLTQLNAGTCDIASGGMFVTGPRLLTNAFSCNITTGSFSAIILKANSTAYTTISSFGSSVTVGALANSTQATYVGIHYPSVNLVSVPTAEAALPLIRNGTIAAWLTSQTTAGYFAQSTTDIATIQSFGDVNSAAFAFRYDSATTTTAAPTTTNKSSSSASVVGVAYAAAVAAMLFALLF